MVEAITNSTSGSALTLPGDADVRLRARSLIVEGAQTGSLRAALKQVPKQMPQGTRESMAKVSKPSRLDVKARASALISKGASTGNLRQALKQIPKNAQRAAFNDQASTTEQSLPSPLDVKRRASSLIAEGARTGALRTALKQVSKPTPLVALSPSYEIRVQDVTASQQGAAPDADPAEQIAVESPQPTPNSLSGTSLGMASMRGTPTSLAGTASTQATPSSAHVRSRSKELLLEGARTGNLKVALTLVPKHTPNAIENSHTSVTQSQPTPSAVKQRAQALMMEGATTGNLRAALKQIPRGAQQVAGSSQAVPQVAPEEQNPSASHVRSRSKELLLEGARTGNLKVALTQVPKHTPNAIKHSHTDAIKGQPTPSAVKQRAQALMMEGATTGNLRAALKQIPRGAQQAAGTSQEIQKVAPEQQEPSASHVRSRSKEMLLEEARAGNLRAALKQIPKHTPNAIPKSQTEVIQDQPSPSDVKQRARALMMEGTKTGNLRVALKKIPKVSQQVDGTPQGTPNVELDKGKPIASHVRSRSKELLLEGARTGKLQAALNQIPKHTPQAIPTSQTRQNQELSAAAEQGQPTPSDVKQRAQVLQDMQGPDLAQNENTELDHVAEHTVAAAVLSVVDQPQTPMYDLHDDLASRQASRQAEEVSFEDARCAAAVAAGMAAAGWIAVAMERATAASAEASEKAVAATEALMADDAALQCDPATMENSTELQQQSSSLQPERVSMTEDLLLDDARTESTDAAEAWVKRVRQMLADESAAVPGRSLNSQKVSPRMLRKALGLPDLSGRSQFAGISDDGASSAFHVVQDGLETPPSPPAPSSDRSRYSSATPASPGNRSLRKSLSRSRLDFKIPEIPACGLKKSSPPSSDGSRKAAAAREKQSAVPVLDMKKVHMGQDTDDIDENTQNKSDRTGAAYYGSTSNWDAGGSEDATSCQDADADDFGSEREENDPDVTNLEVRPPSGGGSGTPSNAASKDAADAPAKLPELLPLEPSGAGPSPTAIALLGALLQQQADKVDWPSAKSGAKPGAKAKASPKKAKSVFAVPLQLPKKPKKLTPAELSSVRLSPMPGSKESGRSQSNGSKGRNSKDSRVASKLTCSKSLPSLPAIWQLGVQKIVHSHFHHHYHVFTGQEDAASQADDDQEGQIASEQQAGGVGMEF
eukprot:TRINITY_DN1977_c0_g1_i2.p1 TRINITY_DN1977_c0_g1~~TRINITY_DN1977_c0_g1_i2.p1  ORF type:complete len:1166 (-),score=215.62 TRINITY_DN1977_c0_g1_i2:213-3710(-)